MTPARAPIMLYGLDKPFALFSAAIHGNFKLGYLANRDTTDFKFFVDPIYVHCHGVVRREPKWGKYTFSIEPEESDFIRQVESTVMQTYARIIELAEPSSKFSTLTLKPSTYENLLQVKMSSELKAVDAHGASMDQEEALQRLSAGTRVRLTLQISGLYHNDKSKGLMMKVHSYVLV